MIKHDKRFQTTIEFYVTDKQIEYINSHPEFIQSLDNAISAAVEPYKKLLREKVENETPDSEPKRKFKAFWTKRKDQN